jgi:hypothetical protein
MIIADGAAVAACAEAAPSVDYSATFKLAANNKKFTTCTLGTPSTNGQSAQTKALSQEVNVTVSSDIPEGSSIVLTWDSAWGSSSVSTCTVTGLSNTAAGVTPNVDYSVTTRVTITTFGAVATGSAIGISCNYMTAPNANDAADVVVQSLNITDPEGDLINEWCSNPPTVNVTQSTSTVGVSSEWANTISPTNLSQSNCNGTLKFKLSQTLPKGSEMTVAYPNNLTNALSSTADLKDHCWSTVQYKKCETSGQGIKLTLDADVSSGSYIEIFLDGGFNTGADTTVSTNGFDVTATWMTESIISDPDTGYSTASKFTATAAITGTITEDAITITANNAGESSDYLFSFKSSVGYTVGDSIKITFPREYDLFVGYASEWFTEEANVYYMMCSSTALGATWCTVSKREVTITGSVAVESTSAIDITLKYVHNPSTATSR